MKVKILCKEDSENFETNYVPQNKVVQFNLHFHTSLLNYEEREKVTDNIWSNSLLHFLMFLRQLHTIC